MLVSGEKRDTYPVMRGGEPPHCRRLSGGKGREKLRFPLAWMRKAGFGKGQAVRLCPITKKGVSSTKGPIGIMQEGAKLE